MGEELLLLRITTELMEGRRVKGCRCALRHGMPDL